MIRFVSYYFTETIEKCKGKPLINFKDLHKLKLRTDFDFNLTSFLGGVMDDVLIVKLGMKSDKHRNLSGASVTEDFKIIKGFFP